MIKRLFDILFSSLGIIFLFPLFVFVSLWIAFDSRGGVFFQQVRVGRNGVDFKLLKFRSMRPDSDKQGLLTIGGADSRITNVGLFIRKYKIDELPQLLNVLFGDMSLVGPRPEVRKYVNRYNAEQLQVLKVRPGITDYASIEYSNENELLAKAENPEEFYINEVMPEKLKLNLIYVAEQGLATDIKLIFKTIAKILK